MASINQHILGEQKYQRSMGMPFIGIWGQPSLELDPRNDIMRDDSRKE